jgi:hypothetical protein
LVLEPGLHQAAAIRGDLVGTLIGPFAEGGPINYFPVQK